MSDMDRLKSLEKKLDAMHLDIQKFIEVNARHGVEISWIKGSIKVGGGVLLTILTGTIGYIIRILIIK